jgi:hypothetical protein
LVPVAYTFMDALRVRFRGSLTRSPRPARGGTP